MVLRTSSIGRLQVQILQYYGTFYKNWPAGKGIHAPWYPNQHSIIDAELFSISSDDLEIDLGGGNR